jgi:hypothetical protein
MVQEDIPVEEPEYGLGWNAKKEGEVFNDVKEDVEEDCKGLEEIVYQTYREEMANHGEKIKRVL